MRDIEYGSVGSEFYTAGAEWQKPCPSTCLSWKVDTAEECQSSRQKSKIFVMFCLKSIIFSCNCIQFGCSRKLAGEQVNGSKCASHMLNAGNILASGPKFGHGLASASACIFWPRPRGIILASALRFQPALESKLSHAITERGYLNSL